MSELRCAFQFIVNRDSFAIARALMQPMYDRVETPVRLPLFSRERQRQGRVGAGTGCETLVLVLSLLLPKEVCSEFE